MVEMDTLDLRKVLAWIEVAAEDMSAAANLDFVLGLRKLVKSSVIDFERVGWFSFSAGDQSKITRLDLVLDFYQAVKSEGLKLRDVDGAVKQISRTIASGIVIQTIGAKADLWEQRKESLLKTSQKKKKNKERSTDEKVFIEDVEMLKQKFSLQHSLLLAELQQCNRLYESDRLAVLWHVLRYDFETQELILPHGTVVESDTSQAEAGFIFQRLTVRGKVQSNKKRPRTSVETPSNLLAEGDTHVPEQRLCHLFPTFTPGEKQVCSPLNTIAAVNYLGDINPDGKRAPSEAVLGTKRASRHSAGDLEGNVEDQIAKRVCQRPDTAREQESVIIPEAGSGPDTDFLTDGAELQDSIVKLTWSEIGEALGLEYTGQGAVSGCTDRQIHYKWSAISAINVMGLRGELPASSTDDWLFYEVHPSNLHKLPFAILSYLIQRSMSWKAVRGQGRDMSACLKLALPRANRQDYGPFCRLSCVVPGADTSEHDQN